MRFGWKLSTSSLHILLAAQVFFTLYVWRVVPESMSEDEQTRARESYKSARGAETRNLSQKIKSFASLINPFALLGPTATNTHGGPLRHDGKDWSLTLFVLGLSLPLLGVVSTSVFDEQVACQLSDNSTVAYILGLDLRYFL